MARRVRKAVTKTRPAREVLNRRFNSWYRLDQHQPVFVGMVNNHVRHLAMCADRHPDR